MKLHLKMLAVSAAQLGLLAAGAAHPASARKGRTQCHGNFNVQRQHHRERDV